MIDRHGAVMVVIGGGGGAVGEDNERGRVGICLTVSQSVRRVNRVPGEGVRAFVPPT